METINLEDGVVYYYPTFYKKETADKLFDILKNQVVWKQEQSRWGPFPRLTAYYSDKGVKYAYSGVEHPAAEWPQWLAAVRDVVVNEAKAPFNSILLNYYRSGQDSISWHSDSEKELGENPIVSSISLGTERVFLIKHKTKKKEKRTFRLGHGSLLIMGGMMQQFWLHSVPKTEEIGERINLTFRNIKA
jgi:alkylated DNA repair dioxygenase AlkB